ncbi:MAG: endonuclease/exonuclease/phosphatase family protein [Acidobacteria bacterium]|nr:endonuclease/exonuclease/phosphatase family protein [Acidobacteriota bacterium]
MNLLLLLLAALHGQDAGHTTGPELLTFDELVLLNEKEPDEALKKKVDTLLTTPFIGNAAHLAQVPPHRPNVVTIGPALRVTEWNIERGSNFDLIRLAFTDPDAFEKAFMAKQKEVTPQLLEAKQQSVYMKESDVLILNEVDYGMTRTEYRDVAKELAAALGMNYAYGVEFLEVDSIYLGTEELVDPDEKSREQFKKDMTVDRGRYKGMHGTAILSRYPITAARSLRFKVCYDWYASEKEELSKLEKGRRLAADKVFLERIGREVRRGGRMALIADIAVPDSPTKTVTIVAAHLENKCRPDCRVEQMDQLLKELERVKHPIVMGGDLNTTGADGAPTSVWREVKKRVRNPEFWAGQAITWFSPVAIPKMFSVPGNYFKNYHDPSATHVPFVAPNKEAALFDTMEKFRFIGGTSFDYSGDPLRSINARGGKLSASNERAAKGFTTTYSFKRDLKGIAGRMRLDWLLVKPVGDDGNHPFHFAPYFGRTLESLNTSVPDGISDHHPITVDLPLQPEPPKK